MKIARAGLGALLGCLTLAAGSMTLPASASTDLRIVSAFTSRYQNGADVPHTPMIGETYRLTVKYKVVGDAAKPFKIRFRMAGQEVVFPAAFKQPGDGFLSAGFDLPLDGDIAYSVYLDPDHTAGEPVETGWFRYMNNQINGSFTPAPPSKAIDYYAPRTLIGTQQAHVDFSGGGTVNRFLLMMGQPDTAGSQKLLHSLCSVNSAWGTEVLAPTAGNSAFTPVFVWDRENVPAQDIWMTRNFTVEARNIRADADELRQVTWAQLDAIAGIDYFKYYQQPEAIVQSQSPAIRQFVAGVLGANFRGRYTPYDAARALFQAVVKRMSYVYPSPSATAVEAYTSKQGDCGAFSLLIVAAMRNIGFPARTACGMWEGAKAEGHCWSECYFPGKGWLVHDGSQADGWDADGDYAYCFGAIRDLNARVAWSQGNTFNPAPGVVAWWAQSPTYRNWGKAPSSFTTTCGILALN